MKSELLPHLNFARLDEGLLETHHTSVGASPIDDAMQPLRSNTAMLLERIESLAHYRGPRPNETVFVHGYYRDRHVIGTGTPVLGGVYMGHRPREALLVLATAPALCQMYHWLLGRYFSERRSLGTRVKSFLRLLPRNHTGLADHTVLERVHDFVQLVMPFDESANSKVARDLGVRPDDEVLIDEYLKARKGVCRHQVCLFAALIEMMQQDGYIDGRVMVQRKSFAIYSHAWARFTTNQGRVYIIDVAQKRSGWLAELSPHERAFYQLPHES